ncbi:phage tail sheath family protein [Candidatus Pantoea multigeneris]|uniref:Phage tail sheath family protein n=1 Tax=Candidatus Pantoea multigeneris TaxID=2608357 RepID=A0ABX0R560_9GAMM|nr:phage tail sheath family protein [Pantoea multigeneris]NIF20541.1 phage tail sheath family protein [Pantoea multigeneris]
MLNFPLAPGVHIDDITRSSLSVTATAPGLPVMVIGNDGPWSALSQPYLVSSFAEIERWLQGESGVLSSSASASGFASARPVRKGGNPAHQRLSSLDSGPENHSSSEPDWTHPSFSALKAYFDNGGGACYLCRSDQLNQIADLSDATLVVQAGQPLAVGLAISALCQPGSGLFALLDGPNDAERPGDDTEPVKRQPRFDAEALATFVSGYNANASAALYYPWLSPLWLLYQRSGEPVAVIHPVAPSAVAAALIQQTDRQIGPWKAPANLTLQPGLQPLVKVGDASQARFNQDGTLAVNMLREFPGIGVQLWGARTLSAGDVAWRYVPVRRTFDRIERDMQQSLRKVLFKPNGPQTWQQLRNAAENYLFGLFEAGAFAGTTPEQCYQVQVGVGSSMTEQDLNDGILRMNIGLAVVRPAEFIVLEFSQTMASAVSGDVVTPIREPLPELEPVVNYVAPREQPEGYELIANAFIGRSVGMSADGRTVIFGGDHASLGMYIYQQRSDSQWEPVFKAAIAQSGPVTQYALNQDGSAAFIGVPNGNKLYFARRIAGTWPEWDEWQQVVPVPQPNSGYGQKIAISPDGSRLAVYAKQATYNDPASAGAVYLWYYQDNIWQHKHTLQAEQPQENERFGYQMSFNRSGEQLVIFSQTLKEGEAEYIKVTTCTLDDTGVTRQDSARIPASGTSFASLHPSGELIAIGNRDFENNTGKLQLYQLQREGWIAGQLLEAKQTAGDYFGQYSIFSPDGNTFVVHTSSAKGQSGTNYSGKVWIFQLWEGEWTLKQTISAPEDKDFTFSSSLATDYAANRLFIGEGQYCSEEVENAGRVWIYDKQ